MRKVIFGLAIAAFCLQLTGCGGCGSPSASSMRRYALKNAPEVEETPPPAAASPQEPQEVAPSTSSDSAKPAAAAATPRPAAANDAATPIPPAAPPVAANRPPKVLRNERPSQPLSPAECRARSVANLDEIGKALVLYASRHKRLPPPSINNNDGEKMLSWRVAILPELGYPELRAKFRPHEPWDSPHNRQLLPQIPPEYQSPERFDTKTNYMGIAGIGMALGTPGGLLLANMKDGADNTIAVMEVDERYAYDWTRPVDFAVSLEEPGDGVGALRGDGVFVALASGRTVLVPRDLPPDQWAALYTPARGEPVVAAELLGAPLIDLPVAEAVAPSAGFGPVVNSAAPADASKSVASAAAFRSALPVLPSSAAPNQDKMPVPSEEDLIKARELLKELYGDEYSAARTAPERLQFVKRLLTDAPKVEQNPADYYELLKITRDVAAGLGDLPSVLTASKRLEEKFQIDPLPPRLNAITDVAKVARPADAPAILTEARRLLREAQDADRYDLALQTHELALSIARVQGDRAELNRLQQQRQSLELSKASFDKLPAALAALQSNPNDATAHEQVGKYLCFVKNRWDEGLPHLVRAADIKLRVIAAIDLTDQRSPQETLSLGDQYWELAGSAKPPSKRGLHLRAVHCYETAARDLAGSLEKIKAHKRIEEASALYGRDEIESVIGPLRKARTGDRES